MHTLYSMSPNQRKRELTFDTEGKIMKDVCTYFKLMEGVILGTRGQMRRIECPSGYYMYSRAGAIRPVCCIKCRVTFDLGKYDKDKEDIIDCPCCL